jgi:hypothetical protein
MSSLSVTLPFCRSTNGTHLFKLDENVGDTPITSLYVRKTGMAKPPSNVHISVTWGPRKVYRVTHDGIVKHFQTSDDASAYVKEHASSPDIELQEFELL